MTCQFFVITTCNLTRSPGGEFLSAVVFGRRGNFVGEGFWPEGVFAGGSFCWRGDFAGGFFLAGGGVLAGGFFFCPEGGFVQDPHIITCLKTLIDTLCV